MDIYSRIMLLTTLGQVKQLRLWLPKMDYIIPPDVDVQILKREDGDILNLLDMEVDLFGKLARFIVFLEDSKIIDNENIVVEADIESYDNGEEFSVLLNFKGELILTYTNNLDKQRFHDKIMIEWTKSIVKMGKDNLAVS